MGRLKTKDAYLLQIIASADEKHIVMSGAGDVDKLFWRICRIEEFAPQPVGDDRIVGAVKE